MRRLGWIGLIVTAASLFGQDHVHARGRPRVGLVLEGGGALGFAHIGVLEYLEQHHIPVDLLVGTSMGGLVAGLHAIGESPSEIRQLTHRIDWDEVLSGTTDFQDLSFRRKEDKIAFPNRLELGLKNGVTFPGGLNSGQQVGLVLDRATLAYPPALNFDDLPIPFRCVATDITERKMKVFAHGSIAQALRATMSIPAVFAPVTIDGHVYSDGGAVDNLPVDVAKQAGADIVIAVYLDPGAPSPKAYDSMLTVAAKNISIMVSANELRNMQTADILLSADLSGFTSASFKEGEEIIPKGYAAAAKKEKMLDALAVSDADWDAYTVRRDAKIRRTVPVPQFIDVSGPKPDYNRTLKESLAPYVGKPVDPPALEKLLTRVTGTGVISTATYTVAERQGVPGLEVRTEEKPYGPPFLDLSVNIDGSDPDNVLFGVAARLTFTDLGGYRAEWRNDAFFGSTYGIQSEYYRPFSGSSKFFFAPHIYALSSPFNEYAGTDRLAQYRIDRYGFGVDVGYAINSRSEIRIGQDLEWLRSVKKIADDPTPNYTERDGVSDIRYRYYGVDNPELPRGGLNLEVLLQRYQRDIFKSFPRAELRAAYFHPVSKPASVFFTASGGTNFKTSTIESLLQSFSLGGPLRLGAYGQNELVGNQYFLFQAGYERKLSSFSPLLGEGLYAMAFVEAGRVYGVSGSGLSNSGSGLPVDGSLALVARTLFGPAFVGASYGDRDHRKWWFGVGRFF